MKKINRAQLKQLVEATIFVAEKPVSRARLKDTTLADFSVSDKLLSSVIEELILDYQPRGIQLVEVASGYRFQTLDSLAPMLSALWQEAAPRYSRAMLETLALIAYRQPITRGEIEQVRGVAVSSNIIKTLTEREWVKIVGHKEVPGRPALYATTQTFLDYFSLTSLADLPSASKFDALADKVNDSKEVPSAQTDRTNDKSKPESLPTNE